MRDKRYGKRILMFGILFSAFLSILTGSVVLGLMGNYIRDSIAGMAGAVESAAPDRLGDVMHLYKEGDSLKNMGEEVLGQYGYGRNVYSFIPVRLWLAAYVIPFCAVLALLLSFLLYWRYQAQKDARRMEALSGYLDGIMEGKYLSLIHI